MDELFKKVREKNGNMQNWKVWSPDGWNKIKKVIRGKTNLKFIVFQIVIIGYMVQKIYVSLLGIRETIDIEDIIGETNLFMCDYLEKND